MTLQPFLVPGFGGLRLDADPQEVGPQAATDMLNVDLDKPGRARTRDGSTPFSSALAGSSHDLIATNLGSDLLVCVFVSASNVHLAKITTAGTTTDVGAILTNNLPSSLARFGTPTSELLFIATKGSVGAGSAKGLYKFNGTTLSASVGSPRHVDVSPSSNRLIQGGFAAAGDSPTGANGSPYTVHWSDAGLPETYTSANNQYVHFGPGDGYILEAVKTWRDATFIFKGNCFYVVYNESIDSTGKPIFQNRRQDIEGLLYTSRRTCSVAAGSDALYYVTTRGVYRTTGGPGQLISQAISPVFTDLAQSLHINSFHSLSFAKGRLYLVLSIADDTQRTFVYDPTRDQWMLWLLPDHVCRFVDWRTDTDKQGAEERIYTVAADKVQYLNPAATADDTTAIESSYTSGLYELAAPGSTAYTRWTSGWGYGTPILSVLTDHASTDARAAAMALGTSPAVVEGRHQQSYTGQLFAHKISSTSGAWGVSRLQHDIAHVR